MGISWRQDRSGRKSGRGTDPRAARRARHRGQASLSGAFHFRFAQLSELSSADAALCLPPLGRHAGTAPSCGAEMGAPQGYERLPDARGRFAAHSHAARSAMRNFARDMGGATAIEYGLIAGLIALVVIGAVGTVGTTLSSTFYAAMATAP